MGQITTPHPVKLFVGMLAARTDLFDISQAELAGKFGPIDAVGEVLPFDFTDYYEAEMGPGLMRKFIGFERLINPKELVPAKLFANDLEERIAERFGSRRRIINLDPGYVSLSKLVLASTKDYSRRSLSISRAAVSTRGPGHTLITRPTPTAGFLRLSENNIGTR